MNCDGSSSWRHDNSAARMPQLIAQLSGRRAVGGAMKHVLPILLACVAGVAVADTTKVGVSPPLIDLFSSKSGFQCAPFPLGDGTWPRIRFNAAGTVAWWYCQGPSGEWNVNFAAATAADLSASKVLGDLYTVVTASNSVAAFQATVAKRVTKPMNDPSLEPVWKPFFAEMLAGMPAAVVKPSNTTALK